MTRMTVQVESVRISNPSVLSAEHDTRLGVTLMDRMTVLAKERDMLREKCTNIELEVGAKNLEEHSYCLQKFWPSLLSTNLEVLRD